MASYIAIFLCLVCLCLLIILLIRFKKLFSTEAIIDKTRNQMNKMIADINNNAKRDIDLINDSSRRLRALLAESDQKMEQFKLATDRLREMIAIAEKMENQSEISNYYAQNPNVSNIKPLGQKKNDLVKNAYIKEKSQSIDPNASYKVQKMQSSLFDEDNQSQETNIFKDEIKVTQDGAAYKEVPVITTKIFDEKPIINKSEKNARYLNDNIKKLFNQGMQVEDIAKELSCSVAEVQFIIDLN